MSTLELSDMYSTGARAYRAVLLREGLQARTAQGRLIARFALRELSAEGASATLEVADDFSAVRTALTNIAAAASEDAFADLPFRRPALLAALWRALDVAQPAACCSDNSGMPAAQTEAMPAAARDAELAPFSRHCATCHQSNDRSPPNFLRPEGTSAAQGVRHCAQRIYYRLAMWQQSPQAREKTPMPPEIALRGLYAHADWPRSSELNAMKSYAARAIENFDERALLAQPYETLRSCLPARTEKGAQQ